MEDIIQEKISADHLLYVSLKYTKTCDVISNLLLRWARMIEVSIDAILKKNLKNKKISTIPSSPIAKMEQMKRLYLRKKEITEVLKLYLMFRKVKELKCDRIGEFRKNVALKIHFQGEEVNVDLEKLKEYADKLEKFISTTKQILK